MSEHFDVVVLGAGTGGEMVAGELARAGRRVAVVERHRVGGLCAFVACMPSKAVLRAAEVRGLAARAAELGAAVAPLTTDDPVAAYGAAVARRDRIADDRDDHRHVDAFADKGITLLRGDGRVTAPGVLTVTGEGATTELAWDDLVVATGTRASLPPVDGLDDIELWTSDEAWSRDELPASAVVLGGGPVGCEIVQAFARFGCRVTLVETADRLLAAEEPAIGETLAEVFAADGVDVRTGVAAERVEPLGEGVRVHLADGGLVEAARLIVATGRTPNSDGLGLEVLGLDPDGPLVTDERGRVLDGGADGSVAARVWAVGDITGVAPFTHTANYQGRIVAANITGGDRVADYSAVPRTVFTDPEVAAVGLTAAQARDAGLDVVTAERDLAETSRHYTDGAGPGRLVLVADARRRVLVGAAAVGPHAGEWMAEALIAVRAGVGLDVLADVIHPFPTYVQTYETLLWDLAGRTR